jgi:hypothetical protein
MESCDIFSLRVTMVCAFVWLDLLHCPIVTYNVKSPEDQECILRICNNKLFSGPEGWLSGRALG